MPKYLKGIVPDKDGYVTLLEAEGDIVVPRKTTRSLVIPGAIVTVVMGSSEASGVEKSIIASTFFERLFTTPGPFTTSMSAATSTPASAAAFATASPMRPQAPLIAILMSISSRS